MKNKGNKITFIGILISILAIAARLVFYLGFVSRIIQLPFMQVSEFVGYLNIAFTLGLAVCLIGYVFKFLGEKDVFDIITIATILVSIIVSFGIITIPILGITDGILQNALVNMFLLGIGINVIKKGDTSQGAIMLLAFAFLTVVFPLGLQEIFGEYLNVTIMQILTDTELFIVFLFNEVVMLSTLIFASFTASSD